MSAVLQIRAKVQEGHRVEIVAPELPVGDWVEVTIAPPSPVDDIPDILAFIDSLPPSPLTPEEWKARDAEFEADRDAWDRK